MVGNREFLLEWVVMGWNQIGLVIMRRNGVLETHQIFGVGGGKLHDFLLNLLLWFDLPELGGVGWCDPSPVMSMKCPNVCMTHLDHCPSRVLKFRVVI